jgi:hypothetical protein
MAEALPAGSVARLLTLATELQAISQRQRDAPLAEHEAAVLAAVRAALPGLLTAVVEAATSALDPGIATVRQRCPHCGGRVRVDSWRPRRVQTVCGPITVTRPWYTCRPCGHGFSPVDATLALRPRARLSDALVGWLVQLGATTTFREAAALLAELTGLAVAADTIRVQSEHCGTLLATAQDAAVAQVQARREAAAPVEPAPGMLIVETDGVMVRYQDGWHEVKVGVVGGVQDGVLVAPSSVAAREEAACFGPRLLAEAARRGALTVVDWAGPLGGHNLAVLRPVHVVGDGAPWIGNLAEDHFGTRTEVVDFYHASEHLWAAARALDGAETPEAAAWAHARRHELSKHGVAPVRTALAHARAPSAAADTLRLTRGYFATNALRMDYPAIRKQGLPIGSGAVESSAKHVIQQRMKRAGQRWSCAGARAMLALRAHTASGRPPLPFAKRLHSSVTPVERWRGRRADRDGGQLRCRSGRGAISCSAFQQHGEERAEEDPEQDLAAQRRRPELPEERRRRIHRVRAVRQEQEDRGHPRHEEHRARRTTGPIAIPAPEKAARSHRQPEPGHREQQAADVEQLPPRQRPRIADAGGGGRIFEEGDEHHTEQCGAAEPEDHRARPAPREARCDESVDAGEDGAGRQGIEQRAGDQAGLLRLPGKEVLVTLRRCIAGPVVALRHLLLDRNRAVHVALAHDEMEGGRDQTGHQRGDEKGAKQAPGVRHGRPSRSVAREGEEVPAVVEELVQGDARRETDGEQKHQAEEDQQRRDRRLGERIDRLRDTHAHRCSSSRVAYDSGG